MPQQCLHPAEPRAASMYLPSGDAANRSYQVIHVGFRRAKDRCRFCYQLAPTEDSPCAPRALDVRGKHRISAVNLRCTAGAGSSLCVTPRREGMKFFCRRACLEFWRGHQEEQEEVQHNNPESGTNPRKERFLTKPPVRPFQKRGEVFILKEPIKPSQIVWRLTHKG